MTSTQEYSLSDIFKHLKFDFRDAVKHTNNPQFSSFLSQTRINYHRTLESIVSQITFVAYHYQSLLKKTKSFASHQRPRKIPVPHSSTNLDIPEATEKIFFPQGSAGRRSRANSIVSRRGSDVSHGHGLGMPSISINLDSPTGSRLNLTVDRRDSDTMSSLQDLPTGLLATTGRMKIGIMLPDLFPDSAELLCNLILRSLLKGLDVFKEEDFVVLSRRGPRMSKKLLPEFQNIKCEWDWSSPSVLASFDFVIIASTNIHVPLVRETTNTQTDPYATTLFMFTCGGITRLRAQNIVKSDHVLLPFFHNDIVNGVISSKTTDAKFGHWMVPGEERLMKGLARGVCVPDLTTMKQVFELVLMEKGLSQVEAKEAIQELLPKTQVEAIEAFDALNLPRLSYPETPIQCEIEDPVKQIELLISSDPDQKDPDVSQIR